ACPDTPHFNGALIARLRQRSQDVTVRPALLTVGSMPQLLGHIAAKEQQRAPGSEPLRSWRRRLTRAWAWFREEEQGFYPWSPAHQAGTRSAVKRSVKYLSGTMANARFA